VRTSLSIHTMNATALAALSHRFMLEEGAGHVVTEEPLGPNAAVRSPRTGRLLGDPQVRAAPAAAAPAAAPAPAAYTHHAPSTTIPGG